MSVILCSITTTKTICSNASPFFRGRLKFHPFLQIERSYCSDRPASKKIFLEVHEINKNTLAKLIY